LHDKASGKPYLGEPRFDIHDHDEDSDPPSKSENEADDPESEPKGGPPMNKGKQQAESSSEDELDQQIRNSPVDIQSLCEVPALRKTDSFTNLLQPKRPNIAVPQTPAIEHPSPITIRTKPTSPQPTIIVMHGL